MNPSPGSRPFGEPHGCDGHGCASDLDTWPLHHVYSRGERRRLCSSCILLSHRSHYCCCCFLIITLPSSHYDHGDPLMGPSYPTVTCHVCRDAVAHLGCLYPADGIFVCPACSAAEEGRPFTYAPPCGVPLDERAARVILLGARMALALLRRESAAARAEAERLARVASEAWRIANHAVSVAQDLDTQEPAWNFNAEPLVPPQGPENNRPAAPKEIVVDAPQHPEDHLTASGSQANVEDALLVRRYAMPPLAALTIGTRCPTAAAVALAAADFSHTTPWSWSLPPFGANGVVRITTADSSSSRDIPTRPRTVPPLFGVKEIAMAAAEAARPSSPPPPTPPTLQLFPAGKASAKPKRRTLQLFEDEIPDDDEKEMQRCSESNLMSSN
ncbi:hypothetical protein BAE44_0013311 [Dichanthelium oligosanthes]|uniref:Uncharacterized protein n=1 Tax=Dichanthelium oligosanthes TaxID=888268 RepID=A0A1E5VKK8_9POAL|nr:hypothetical protein BAE44_0013311 [Dichanthelium oligosanthes]